MTIHRREEEMGGRMVGDAMVRCLPILDLTLIRVENRTDLSFPRATSIGVCGSARYGRWRQRTVLVRTGVRGHGVIGPRADVGRRE